MVNHPSRSRKTIRTSPCPWESTQGLYGRPDETTIWSARNKEGAAEFIATLGNQQNHDKGNAALIAAAPDLLAALKDAIMWVSDDDQAAPEYKAKWRAIVSKAEG